MTVSPLFLPLISTHPSRETVAGDDRKWFLRQETDLFRYRLKNVITVPEFIKQNKLHYENVRAWHDIRSIVHSPRYSTPTHLASLHARHTDLCRRVCPVR